MIYEIRDKAPVIKGQNCFIAESADVIGEVILEEDTSVWFNAVIRADIEPITIGEGSNIQDGSVLHVDEGFPLVIGNGVTVGHKVMLHGCHIQDGALIGINAVVLNGAVVGKNALIGANALVTEGTQIPDNALFLGSPGKVIKTLDPQSIAAMREGTLHYIEKAKIYANELKKWGQIKPFQN